MWDCNLCDDRAFAHQKKLPAAGGCAERLCGWEGRRTMRRPGRTPGPAYCFSSLAFFISVSNGFIPGPPFLSMGPTFSTGCFAAAALDAQ